MELVAVESLGMFHGSLDSIDSKELLQLLVIANLRNQKG